MQFGVVPEISNAYFDYSPFKNLVFSGRLYGLSKKFCQERALQLLKESELQEKMNIPVKKLSKGQKQRLNFCMALLHDPEILFLDEPTAGLDVKSIYLVRERITRMKKQGKTVFLTTHDMKEANILCDEIIILNRGKIVATGSPTALREKFLPASKITLELQDLPSDFSFLETLKMDYELDTENKKVTFLTTSPLEEFSKIQALFLASAYKITQIQISPASLEEIFLKILGDK